MSTRGDIPRVVQLRSDDDSITEPGFFETETGSLFGVTHIPDRPTGLGVVISSPINNDYLKNNRREVLLSRRLAARGIAVQRYHYAGTGNSDGDAASITVGSMIEDTQRAAAHLGARTQADRMVFMGSRMGALAAAAAAAAHGAPLAMWEPITEGRKYFRELFRTMMIVGMNASDGDGASMADIKSAFERDRTMDVAGFSVGWAMHEDANERQLTELYGDGTAPVFLAQFREKSELKPEYAKLVTGWEEGGRKVKTHHVPFEEAWHLFVFGFRAEEERQHSQRLLDATVDWIAVQA
ncbi:MAG: alpha/beta hydrolase [Acidimicrobiia bacterium]|nr:alpha/beta hydrolase [Acidimicrobiia bacterium]